MPGNLAFVFKPPVMVHRHLHEFYPFFFFFLCASVYSVYLAALLFLNSLPPVILSVPPFHMLYDL